MLRRYLKIASAVIGGLVALVMAIYCTLLVINLHDQPESDEVAILQALHPQTPTLEDSGNAYLFILGMASPNGTDPLAAGRRNHVQMMASRPDYADYSDASVDYVYLQQNDALYALSQSCKESTETCHEQLETNEAELSDWLANEHWRIQRYEKLTDHTWFREPVPMDVLSPLGPYHLVFEGQRLFFVDLWRTAPDKQPAEIYAMLDQDLTFWRMMLAESDALITKMVAAAAIERHFKLSNLVLRRVPPQSALQAVPTSWREPLTRKERSMRRSIAGEWGFARSAWELAVSDGEAFSTLLGVSTGFRLIDRVCWWALKPLWQVQDTENRLARVALDIGTAFDVPIRDLADAADVADELTEQAADSIGPLYNLVGGPLLRRFEWRMSPYAFRVADIEGVRRAALLAVELRANNVPQRDLASELAASDHRNPYTGAAFSWDDASGSIVFRGLEPYERAAHKIMY